jgi:hypothetical protein
MQRKTAEKVLVAAAVAVLRNPICVWTKPG